MLRKPKCVRQTDRQTDMVIPVYPPNFVGGGGGIIKVYIWQDKDIMPSTGYENIFQNTRIVWNGMSEIQLPLKLNNQFSQFNICNLS